VLLPDANFLLRAVNERAVPNPTSPHWLSSTCAGALEAHCGGASDPNLA